MAKVYKLSSSPLVLGSTEIEVTDDIVLYAEVDVETTLKIASSNGHSYTLSKPFGINDQRFFNIKAHGNLSLFNIKLTTGDVSGKANGDGCSNNNGAAICPWHKSSVLFLRNVSFSTTLSVLVVSVGQYTHHAVTSKCIMYTRFSIGHKLGVVVDPFHICEDYVYNDYMPETYFDPAPLNETYFKYEGWKMQRYWY